MFRCRYLVKNKNVYLSDGKNHNTFTCNNKKCKNYLRFSIGKASVCNSCLFLKKNRRLTE